jgi:RNA polymerase sigma-70 factor (ECF subfamily)
MSDAELLRRSAKGDQTAFQVLYERHRDAVYRFAWALTKSPADAEDVVQDCFMALIRKAREYDPKRAQLRTWLFGIARKLSYHRSRSGDRKEPDTETQDRDPGIIAALIRNEVDEAVRRAVMALPTAQREAIVLFEFEQLSLAETAAVLEIEANAVKGRLFRGRELLKRYLSALKPEGVRNHEQ